MTKQRKMNQLGDVVVLMYHQILRTNIKRNIRQLVKRIKNLKHPEHGNESCQFTPQKLDEGNSQSRCIVE